MTFGICAGAGSQGPRNQCFSLGNNDHVRPWDVQMTAWGPWRPNLGHLDGPGARKSIEREPNTTVR